MLVTFFLWPVFFVLGVLFGVLSPIVALCKACREETGKWQTYVRNASALSPGHQKRIKMLAGCFLVCECFQCSDEDNLRGKKVLIAYYKLGHHLGFSLHIITVTLVKVVLFNPFWVACTTSLEDLRYKDDAANLVEGLLSPRSPRPDNSGASSQRKRPSRHGRVKLKDVDVIEPGARYQVEQINPGESRPSNSDLPSHEESEGLPRSKHSNLARNNVVDSKADNNDPSVVRNSQISNDEPWGDWGPG